MPNITPLRDILVLDTTPQEKRTAGGLVLPPSAQDHGGAKNGVIISRGPDVQNHDLQPGVRVVVSKYEAPPILPDNGELSLTHLVREEFILAILPP